MIFMAQASEYGRGIVAAQKFCLLGFYSDHSECRLLWHYTICRRGVLENSSGDRQQ